MTNIYLNQLIKEDKHTLLRERYTDLDGDLYEPIPTFREEVEEEMLGYRDRPEYNILMWLLYNDSEVIRKLEYYDDPKNDDYIHPENFIVDILYNEYDEMVERDKELSDEDKDIPWVLNEIEEYKQNPEKPKDGPEYI